jgi:AraC family transcriptional regulator, transcriptional activator of pobA
VADLIPSFFVYGEANRPVDIGFVHVETVMARKSIHFGRVNAHKHDHMAQITFWTKGQGTYGIEEHQLDFSAPAVSFVPSGTVHGFSVEADVSDAIVISIADTVLTTLKPLIQLHLQRPVMVTGQGEPGIWARLQALVELMLAEYEDEPNGAEEIISPLVAAALNAIGRLATGHPALAQSASGQLSARLRDLVGQNFRQTLPVSHYVSVLKTTPHLLAKASVEAFGLQVKDLILERRLLEAKRLLLFTVRSLDDIAFDIGFRDAAYFSRFFRQRTGLPPSEWRRRKAAGEPV